MKVTVSTQIALILGLLAWNGALAETTKASAQRYRETYRRPAAIPFPESNQWTKDREELGQKLFFDPRLSASNWISCASCHNPGFAWGDALPLGIGTGMKTLERRTPTILNLAWGEIFMWDGRSATLEEQALGPITSAGEMNLSKEDLLIKVQAIKGYQPLFEKAYPGEGITAETIGKAIATFERKVVSAEAPFDAWVNGKSQAISESAQRGFVLFNEKALCSKCHSGWRFTDDSFQDIGLADEDLGRGKVIPGIPVLQHAFKTPTLRNIDQRAPYLHNGSEPDLAAVLAFYNQGGKAERESKSEHIKPLALSAQEVQDIIEFLKTLTSQDPIMGIPVLPR